MKPFGSRLSYSDRRDRELYDVFKRLLPKFQRHDGRLDYDAAVSAAAASPCSRYWISEGMAFAQIRRIKADASCLAGMFPQKRLLYQSLVRTYDKLRNDPHYADCTDQQVAYLASDQPAPSFFMGLKNAKIIICRERHRRLEARNTAKDEE